MNVDITCLTQPLLRKTISAPKKGKQGLLASYFSVSVVRLKWRCKILFTPKHIARKCKQVVQPYDSSLLADVAQFLANIL